MNGSKTSVHVGVMNTDFSNIQLRDSEVPPTYNATAMSFDEAEEFSARPQWHGRLVAAASNSPQSVTLSGDIDAIEEAMQIFESDTKFARILRTDTAYHSHHMQPCAEPYLRALRGCQIKVNPPRKDCVWISSVRGDTQLLEGGLSTLADQYWVDNMCNPVLFSQAVETSIWNGGPFDVAVELGPHPALKGPVEQTIKFLICIWYVYSITRIQLDEYPI
jgi:aspyridone synthetase (hybrid polyketide synthase/nonribosomal peptide synthetase)